MKDQIEKLVSKTKFTDFGNFGDSVIKFNDKYSDNNISKVYIDYSDKVFKNAEEVLARHQEIVEQDFFKTSGSLQWNFYYYFVFNKETYDKIKNTPLVREIESNTAFTRKKIVTLESLAKSYPFTSIIDEVNSQETTYSDLSHEWTRILSENDLDEVFSEDKDATYDKVITRFIEGNPVKDLNEDASSSVSDKIESPVSIQKLNLKRYRSFPLNQSFDFCNVNLVEGVNGKGKTSLLEAIELLMCGKTFRHEKSEDADISLFYNSSNTEEMYEPKNTKKFQAREQFWYGIPATHNRNTLHTNFNRFNFFNTDASYRFSQSDEAGIIWKSFQALALGGNTAELGKRIRGFEDRFSKELKRAEREKASLEIEVEQLVESKKQINQSSSSTTLDASTINLLLTKLGSSVSLDPSVQSSLSETNSLFTRSISRINSLLERFPTENSLTMESIENIYKYNLRLESSMRNILKDLDSLERQKIELNSKLKELIKKEHLLKRFEQYLKNNFAFNIRKIEEKLLSLAQANSNKYEILKTLSDFDLLQTENELEILNDRIQKLDSSLSELLNDKNAVDLKIRESKESFEGLKQVVVEIKTLGRRFLSLSKSDECPLCETTFERKVLEEKISQINLDDSDLSKQLEQKQALEGRIKRLTDESVSLKKISSVIRQLSGSDDVPIEQAKATLKYEKQELKDSIESYNENKKTYDLLVEQGFSSNEFLTLLGALGIDAQGNKEDIVNQVEAVAKEISSQVNKKKLELQEKENKQISLRDSFKTDFPDITVDEFNSDTADHIHIAINKVKNGYKELKSLMEDFSRLPSSTPLSNLNDEFKSYSEEIVNYRAFVEKIKQQTATLKQIDVQINTKKKLLEEVRVRYYRCDKAVKAFNRISDEHGIDVAVTKFFVQNKSIIVNIFKAIHTPNEFEDLEISDQKIYVVKSGEKRELNTISTGQRTAVALSIFLGMHLSCPMAPKVILLDDPIAFVDDLNVLAVLDFLREIVIKGNRQLFFATANKKLSSLFKRKFDLLPGSLQVISPNANN